MAANQGIFATLARVLLRRRPPKIPEPDRFIPAAPPAQRNAIVEGSVRTFVQWSPQLITAAKVMADSGNMTLAADLVESLLLEDDRFAGTLNQRVLGLLGLPLEFEPYGDGRKKTAVTKALDVDFWTMFPESELAKLITWGLALGVSLGELVWEDGGPEHGGRVLPKLKFWHPRWLRYDWGSRRWALTIDSGAEVVITPGDGRWILFTPYGASRPWSYGTWRPCALWSLLKSYARQDWGRHGELAAGIRTAEVPAGAKLEDRQQLAADLGAIGRDSAVVPPNGYKISAVSLTANTYETFLEQINTANQAIAVANTGQSLSSGVDGGGTLGTGGASNLHSQVLQSFIDFDGQVVPTTLRYQGLTYWAEFNFGSSALAPWPCWETEPPEDKGAVATTTKTASEGLNILFTLKIPVDVEAYCEKFSIPLKAGLTIPDPTAPTPAPSNAPQPPGAAPRVLSAGLPSALVQGQAYADQVVDAALPEASKALAGALAKIQEAITASTSYPDLRQRLIALLPQLDPSALAKVVEGSTLLALGAGLWSAREEKPADA